MPNWRKVITSGSDASLNSLVANSYISASSFSGNLTGSVFGTSSWAITASFAITSSYGLNPTVSGSLNNVDAVYFNTSSTAAIAPGALLWDNGEGTLQLGLVGGNIDLNLGEDLYQYVYNAESVSLIKGNVVYVSGSQGQRIAVKLASATSEGLSAETLGFVAETIPAGGEGWVMTEGSLRGIDTSGFTGGEMVFLNTVPGDYTNNRPIAPVHGVRLGYAQKIGTSDGIIYVKIDNGYELDELHDVKVASDTTGDLLIRSASVWINSKQMTGSYGLTGSLWATSFTGSLFGTASQAVSSSYAATASFANTGFTINTTSYYVTSSTTAAGTTTVSSVATGSFTSAFYNYTIRSGSNARSGQMMSVWSGSSIQYTEVTTLDIGSTATASLAVALSGANVNLNFTAPGVWTVKSIANLL